MDALKSAAFAAKRRARSAAGRLYADALHHQTLPPEELRSLTTRRSIDIARWAAERTVFYPAFFRDHGVARADLEDPSLDWDRLPILERAMVKSVPAEQFLTTHDPRHVRPALTGGSTGEPVKIFHDARVPLIALSWRMYSWWGIRPWDDLARVGRWGFGRSQRVRNAAAWWPTRQRYLDAGLLDEAGMRALLAWMSKHHPPLLEGYVGALLELAGLVERENTAPAGLRAVGTTAAPLTEEVRLRLQTALRAPVYDEYRSAEVGWIAGECTQQDGLHIFSDYRRVEVVDDHGVTVPDGTTGHLVLTDLSNRAFPLIRYRNGDRGTLLARSCRCGLALPLLGKPDGRTTDVLRLPSGKVLAHRLMAMFSEDPGAVRLFQIHQLADHSIVVRVVLGEHSPWATDAVETAVQTLRHRVCGEVPVRLEYVESLPYTRGKLKYVISDVAHTGTGQAPQG